MCDIKTLELFRIQMTSLSGRRFYVYIVYHPPSGTKLSGTETDFYSDLDYTIYRGINIYPACNNTWGL